MPDTTPVQVAAYLDDAQKRYEAFGESDAMPRLLAVVAEVLKLPDRWEAAGIPGDAQSECAAELRRVIARELLSKEDGR